MEIVVENPDVVAAVSALISIGLAIYVVWHTKRQDKKRTVLHLHEIWTSEYYRKARERAYGYFRDAPATPILYSELRTREPEIYEHLGA